MKVRLLMIPGSETRPVEVIVDLPVELVEDVKAVRDVDPDFFNRAIRYALARRFIYEELSTIPVEQI